MKKRHLFGVTSGVFALSLVVGCGGPELPDYAEKLVPVSGKITRGGEPLEGAQVFFVPVDNNGEAADGYTDAEGKYELITQKAGPGAVPANYNVAISRFEVDGKPVPQDTPPADVGAMESIPPRYSTYGQSRLTATVPEGGKSDLDFEI